MNKKPSIDIKIFAWLVIITTSLTIPLFINPVNIIKAYIKPFGLIFYISAIPLTILELVFGFNILRLREWARKYLVLLIAFYALTIFVTPFLIDRNYEQEQIQQTKIQLQREVEKRSEPLSPQEQEKLAAFLDNDMMAAMLVKLSYWIYLGAFFMLYMVEIFYFTRPRVKEQFS